MRNVVLDNWHEEPLCIFFFCKGLWTVVRPLILCQTILSYQKLKSQLNDLPMHFPNIPNTLVLNIRNGQAIIIIHSF